VNIELKPEQHLVVGSRTLARMDACPNGRLTENVFKPISANSHPNLNFNP